ncbi:MAG TPA: ankyrin repeat domain-containing protein, partial [Vicinamibacterales bacterium]
MGDNVPRRLRILLAACLLAMALGSSRCVPPGGCAAPPQGFDRWASAQTRSARDRADLEALLAMNPGVANSHYGWDCGTLLHAAATRGREDLAPLLIARGADLNARDRMGNTPLNVAATYGRANVMTVLLAAGANANGNGPTGTPPLQSAVGGQPGASDLEKQLAAIRLLLAAGADINGQEPGSARTALITAIGSGPRTGDDEPMIEFLLEHGADVHARDSHGTAALVYAAGTGNLRIVTLLLQRGADKRGAAR